MHDDLAQFGLRLLTGLPSTMPRTRVCSRSNSARMSDDRVLCVVYIR